MAGSEEELREALEGVLKLYDIELEEESDTEEEGYADYSEIINKTQERLDYLSEKAEAIYTRTGMSEDELEAYAANQSNFSKEEWEALQKVKEAEVIWTTQEGYQKLQKRINHIGTVETVDNAREIEAARAHGDLRENAEYKFALERRSRLQGELKTLTHQLNLARILTKEDMTVDQVDVGAIVSLSNSNGAKITYTLLGPWDADPEQNILSFQSKLAQAMMGHKEGETFDFQGESYTVKGIKSYLG